MSSRTVRRKRPIRPVSMALTQTSPSPWAAWPSPTENRALSDEHRQIERSAGDEFLVVHVAAELARLDARHRAPGARRRVRHHAEERAQRNLGAPGQPAHHAVALQRHMDHPRLGKIEGQRALERPDRGVAPVVMERDVLDVDLEHLARAGAAHRHRPGAHMARQHAPRPGIMDVVERLGNHGRRWRQHVGRPRHGRDRDGVAAVDRQCRRQCGVEIAPMHRAGACFQPHRHRDLASVDPSASTQGLPPRDFAGPRAHDGRGRHAAQVQQAQLREEQKSRASRARRSSADR